MFKLILQNFSKNFIGNFIKTNQTIAKMSSNVMSDSEIKLKSDFKRKDSRYLLWADCEMTGLDIAKDRLLEIAMIITDNDLNEIERLGPYVITCEKAILDSMDSWCKSTHQKTGLIEKALKSNLTEEMVDNILVEKLNKNSIEGAILAGNSIMFDALFIRKYLKKTSNLLHYRQVDVSTIKTLKERWYPTVEPMHKELKHDALSDILESIEELKYYRRTLFK